MLIKDPKTREIIKIVFSTITFAVVIYIPFFGLLYLARILPDARLIVN